jgi:hypothetical protein
MNEQKQDFTAKDGKDAKKPLRKKFGCDFRSTPSALALPLGCTHLNIL